jgi:putative flippase GtrA
MSIQWQFLRFAIVGLGSNVALYAGYLLATSLGMGHKTAMTLLYPAGILGTFLLNRSWTFRRRSTSKRALISYIGIYAFGYLINFLGLYLFVDQVGYPHQIVQGILIIVVAILLFLLQRFWVFRHQQEAADDYVARPNAS